MKRDRELVRWVARMGAVEVRHVGERFGVGRSVAYELVARSIGAGLLERVPLLVGEPTLIRATRAGIEFSELGLFAQRLWPAQLSHWIACADAAIWAERRWGAENVISERELRFRELVEGEPIASVDIGSLPAGRRRMHRPDLVVVAGERPIAIEVELSPKAPGRLRTIMEAWAWADHLDRVIYLCAPGETMRGVERAIQQACAEDRVSIVEMRRKTREPTDE